MEPSESAVASENSSVRSRFDRPLAAVQTDSLLLWLCLCACGRMTQMPGFVAAFQGNVSSLQELARNPDDLVRKVPPNLMPNPPFPHPPLCPRLSLTQTHLSYEWLLPIVALSRFISRRARLSVRDLFVRILTGEHLCMRLRFVGTPPCAKPSLREVIRVSTSFYTSPLKFIRLRLFRPAIGQAGVLTTRTRTGGRQCTGSPSTAMWFDSTRNKSSCFCQSSAILLPFLLWRVV